MPDLSSLADDDDTGRIRTEAAKGPSSDPGRDLTALSVAFIAHEAQDARRHRHTMWIFGFALSLALAVCAWAWSAQANSGADRATLQDVHDRMVRIEGLLMERDR